MEMLAQRIKNSLHHSLSPYPQVFLPLYRLFGSKKDALISGETEIVIEGFPRCANTFAVFAFMHAQHRTVSVAHHLHSEAQILEGVRRGLPVVVVIRDPLQAVRSLVVRHPEISVLHALKRYIRFYSAVDTVVDKVVLSTFDQTTNNLGSVIDRVNSKFDTSFSIFVNTTENIQAVTEAMININNLLYEGKITFGAYPSDARNQIFNNLEIKFPEPLFQTAKDIFQRLVEGF
jgi:hypothetical protein